MSLLNSSSIRIVEQGENASIVYTNPTGKTNIILFNGNGIYFNGVLSSADAVGAALTPVVRTNNPTIAANSVNVNLTALDTAIGVTPTSTNIISASSTVNANLSTIDTSINTMVSVIAASGSVQGNSPITMFGTVVATSANGTVVVTLPAVSATKYILLYNSVAGQNLLVFPATGEYINAAAQNASVKFDHATLVSCVLCTYASAAHWTMTAIQATIS
jgi:hypothetical protein